MMLARSRRWDGSLTLKAGLAVLVVMLGDYLFWQLGQSGGVQGLFGFGLIAALLLARPAVRRDRRARIALSLAALYALAQVWDPSPLAFALFWVALGFATLLPGTARFDDGWRWLQRLIAHGFKSLLGPLIDLTILSRVRPKRSPGPRSLRRSLPVLVLPLLGSAIFVGLFAQANPVIEQTLAALSLPELNERTLARIVLWGLLLLLVWGVLRARPPRRLFATIEGTGDLVLPGVSLDSIRLSLITFNALFALQNALDAAYLSGLVRLPVGISLADYAHRGAYPLVVTALLAALFVLVTLRPGSSTAAAPPVRRLVTLWIAQNLLLVASAGFRTWDYVEAYSLTVLRLSALLWMALVAVGLVLVLWRMLAEKSASWLINANLAAAGLLLTAVCFVDLGAVSASWNVCHAREIDGHGAVLDLCYLNDLRGSALLSLIELEQRNLPVTLHAQVRSLRRYVTERTHHQRGDIGWSILIDQRLDAADKFEKSDPSYTHHESRPCYGRYGD